MHILMIPSWYRTKENPNYGIFFREQAVALGKSGHEVDVLYWDANALAKTSFEFIKSDGITEYVIHIKRSPLQINSIKLVFAMLRFYYTQYKTSRPHVIHVQSYGAMRYVQFLLRFTKIPCVITEHASVFKRGLLSEKQLKVVRKYYNQATSVLAVSDGLREAIQPLCDKEVIVVPNMVSERFFASQPVTKENDVFKFISVTSLEHTKGIDVLLKGFSKAFLGNKKIQLQICGKGSDRKILEQMSDDLGISSQVMFKGEVSRDECVRLLNESHAFVLSSRVETFGIVFGEAMACGLPIIMSKTDAYKDLVTKETGYAVNIDDVSDLKEKMIHLVDNYRNYDSSTIRAYCKERYSELVVADKITQQYINSINEAF
jgi:glycosyltransferase involved in cell wall biosynthesis